jgi:hypothetical protein
LDQFVALLWTSIHELLCQLAKLACLSLSVRAFHIEHGNPFSRSLAQTIAFSDVSV